MALCKNKVIPPSDLIKIIVNQICDPDLPAGMKEPILNANQKQLFMIHQKKK